MSSVCCVWCWFVYGLLSLVTVYLGSSTLYSYKKMLGLMNIVKKSIHLWRHLTKNLNFHWFWDKSNVALVHANSIYNICPWNNPKETSTKRHSNMIIWGSRVLFHDFFVTSIKCTHRFWDSWKEHTKIQTLKFHQIRNL